MSEKSAGANLPLIIGGIVVLAIVVGGGLFFMNNRNAPQADGNEVSQGSVNDGLAQAAEVAPALAKTDEFGSDGGLGTGVYALDKVEGNPDAPVTIIEYASWTCPVCARFHATTYKDFILPAIEAGTAKLIVRDSLRNGVDFRVAMAARCEGVDFEAASEALYTGQRAYSVNDPEQTDLAVIALLADQGMTAEKYTQCLTNSEMSQHIQAISAEGTRVGVRGTPSVFLNGRKLDNSNDLPRLDELIANAAQ